MKYLIKRVLSGQNISANIVSLLIISISAIKFIIGPVDIGSFNILLSGFLLILSILSTSIGIKSLASSFTGSATEAALFSQSVIGLMIMMLTFVSDLSEFLIWNNTLVGNGIFLLSFYNYIRIRRRRKLSKPANSLVSLLSLWVISSSITLIDEMKLAYLASGITLTALSGYLILSQSRGALGHPVEG